MHQIRFLPQPPLGELTALPQTPLLEFRGPTSKAREGRGGRKGEGSPKPKNQTSPMELSTVLGGKTVNRPN